MADKSKKTVQGRCRIAHKLAKYARAKAVHLPAGSSAQLPSTSHLSKCIFTSAYGGAPKRKLRNKENTWYPADDEKTHYKRKRNQPKAVAGRAGVTAGQVVILLSGSHRGRRVVVLKNLPSNNLLVTGPHAVNGVPLKRVNAAYVIATSTKVSLDGVACNVDDSYFKRQNRFTKNQLKNASETRNKKCQ